MVVAFHAGSAVDSLVIGQAETLMTVPGGGSITGLADIIDPLEPAQAEAFLLAVAPAFIAGTADAAVLEEEESSSADAPFDLSYVDRLRRTGCAELTNLN